MMTRNKKIISTVTAMCLAVSMIPIINGIAYADGLQAADFMAQELGSFRPDSALTAKDLNGVTYDEETKTITLNNVNLVKSLGGKEWFEIWSDNVTIKLVGKNTFTNNNGKDSSCLFSCTGNVNIIGTGALTVNGMTGIYGMDINVKSGKLDITSPDLCINSENFKVASNAKLSLATKKKGSKNNLNNTVVEAKKMTNSYKSLVKVSGYLPNGAEINDKNAVYKIIDDDQNIKMTQWIGGKNAKIAGDMTKKIMGGYYNLSVIGTDSFSNAAGKKVKKITVYSTGDEEPLKIEKYAFRGTKCLTDFYTRVGDVSSNNSIINNQYYIGNRDGDRRLHYSIDASSSGHPYKSNKYVSKLAFKGAGKSNGKKLTVHVLNHANVKLNGKMRKVSLGNCSGPYSINNAKSMNAVYKVYQKNSQLKFKKIMAKYGLNSKAKIVVPKSAVKTKYFYDDKELKSTFSHHKNSIKLIH